MDSITDFDDMKSFERLRIQLRKAIIIDRVTQFPIKSIASDRF